MKKKSLIVSTVALATASAMVFSPVSYKVIDKASAAPAEATEDVVKAAAALKAVFAELNSEPKLAAAYDKALDQAKIDLQEFDLATDLPKFAENFDGSVTDAQVAIVALLEQVIGDYGSDSANLSDVSEELHQKILDLNNALGSDITLDDVAKLAKEVKDGVLARLQEGDISITNLNVKALIDEVVKIATAEWDTNENAIAAALRNVYGSGDAGLQLLKQDAETFKTNRYDSLDAATKKIYQEGSAAFAVSYLKYALKQAPPVTVDSVNGSLVTFSLDFQGLTVPLGFFKWSGYSSLGVNNGELVASVSGTQNVNITAKFDGSATGVPAFLNDVTLFSQDLVVTGSSIVGGGIVDVGAPLTLVSDALTKAAAIDGKVASYLEDYADLRNNSERFGLKAVIENGLREALLVQAAGSVKTSEGLSTFAPTVAQMEQIYSQQLTPVLDTAKKALTSRNIELAIDPVLTYNIGITTNAQVDLSKALIDSLLSKGVASVGVKTGDVVIEVPLAQLTGAAKVNIKKTTANGSDVYSVSVVDSTGKALTAFENQYRVTLPAKGNVNESEVTVAKLNDGSVTHIGGAYYSDTDTITFYANQLGEYSVVENSPTFNDIANLDWANQHIQLLANQGILLGKADGVFDPKGTVTRAEFTAMIVRSFNLSLDGTGVSFNDVNESAWYHGAVEAAVAYGVVSGRSATTFDPNAQITRDEMATMAANALREVLGYVPAQNAADILAGFVDGSSVVPAHTAGVALLADEEIVNGRPDGSFDPKGNASRAEAAVIILNALSQRN